jgi:hypothetical protein
MEQNTYTNGGLKVTPLLKIEYVPCDEGTRGECGGQINASMDDDLVTRPGDSRTTILVYPPVAADVQKPGLSFATSTTDIPTGLGKLEVRVSRDELEQIYQASRATVDGDHSVYKVDNTGATVALIRDIIMRGGIYHHESDEPRTCELGDFITSALDSYFSKRRRGRTSRKMVTRMMCALRSVNVEYLKNTPLAFLQYFMDGTSTTSDDAEIEGLLQLVQSKGYVMATLLQLADHDLVKGMTHSGVYLKNEGDRAVVHYGYESGVAFRIRLGLRPEDVVTFVIVCGSNP